MIICRQLHPIQCYPWYAVINCSAYMAAVRGSSLVYVYNVSRPFLLCGKGVVPPDYIIIIYRISSNSTHTSNSICPQIVPAPPTQVVADKFFVDKNRSPHTFVNVMSSYYTLYVHFHTCMCGYSNKYLSFLTHVHYINSTPIIPGPEINSPVHAWVLFKEIRYMT